LARARGEKVPPHGGPEAPIDADRPAVEERDGVRQDIDIFGREFDAAEGLNAVRKVPPTDWVLVLQRVQRR
jgi:hypothetical protein